MFRNFKISNHIKNLIAITTVIAIITIVFIIYKNNKMVTFNAKIEEVGEGYILVIPFENESIIYSSDKISMFVNGKNIFKKGDKIKVFYDGIVMETYPARINAIKIELIR